MDPVGPGGPGTLRIRLLGGLDVEGVSPTQLGSRKARTLVKLLALGRGAVVSTGEVLDALWPGDGRPVRPVEQVSVLASRLRKPLGPDRLVRTEAGWALLADWLDIVELEARAAEALERLDAGQYASARTAARAALDVMRGTLLPDDEGPWVESERAACERLGGRLRRVLAEAALAAGDTESATVDGERALDVDPFDEGALRVAMRAHAASGRPASALALYVRVRARLADELGVNPTAETEAVHDEVLLADEVPVRTARPSPLVGRALELGRLDAAAQRVTRGGAWALEVVGEAGIGKTTLLDAWSRTTALTVLRARCDELGRELPLQPVLDALGADDIVLGAAEPAAATSVADPLVGQTALLAELVRRFSVRIGSAGGAFVIDDAQWADPMTLAFCRAMRRKGTGCLVALARRTGPGVEVAADERIELGPLTLEAVTELVGSDRSGPLLERSGGNPLFLLHLAASADEDLPASVREAVTSQVESLGREAAASIRAAAVLGQVVDLDLLAAVLRKPAVELLGHLDAGAAIGLLADRRGLVFSHALVRDALEAGTTPSLLAWLHRQAAIELVGRPGADELAVARHAQAGGDRALSSASLVRAAAAAAGRFDLAGAEGLLHRAIVLDDTGAARLARARVRLGRYSLRAAEADVLAAIDRGVGAEAFELAGWVAYYERDYDRAIRYADEGAARASDDAVRASGLALGGRVRHSRGDLAGAEELLCEALRIAPASVRGLAQVWLSSVRSHQSRVAEALELAERALLRPDDLGHPFAVLHGRFVRVTALGYSGRVGEALQAVDEALAVIAEEGEQAARFTSIFLNARGWLLRNLGLLDEADAANLAALDHVAVMTLTGEPYHVAHLDLLDGALARNDEHDIARRLAGASAITAWDGTMSWRQRGRLDLLRARIALRSGEAGAATTLASAVRARAVAWGVPRYRLLAELVVDEAAAGDGTADPDAVAARLEALTEVAAPEAWWRTAELAVALGDDHLAAEAERRAAVLVADAAVAGIDATAAVAVRLVAIHDRIQASG